MRFTWDVAEAGCIKGRTTGDMYSGTTGAAADSGYCSGDVGTLQPRAEITDVAVGMAGATSGGNDISGYLQPEPIIGYIPVMMNGAIGTPHGTCHCPPALPVGHV